MANKIVELTLKVNGAQTLEEMASAARELETELRNAGKGAEGFNKGMASLATARSEMKEFKMDIKGITFDSQIAGATRFVNGFVSSFALMKSATMAFGEEASKSIENVVTTLGGLMTAMTALQNIASAFDGETMKSLKLLGGQWTKLVGVVKNASLTMKAALISTGIGAIVVGLGLIIANWEKIIKFGKEMLGIEQNLVKEAQKRIAYQETMLKIDQERVKIIEEISKLTGDEIESMILKLKYGQLVLDNLRDELIIATDLVKKAEEQNQKSITWSEAWVMIKNGMLGAAGAAKTIKDLTDEELLEIQKINEEEAKRKNLMATIVLEMEKQAILQQEMIAYALETEKLSAKNVENIKKGGESAILFGEMQKQNDEKALKNSELEIQRLGIYKETEAKIYAEKKKQLEINIENRKNILEQAQISVDRLTAENDINVSKFTSGKMSKEELEIQTDFLLAEMRRLNTLKQEIPFMEKQLQNLKDQEAERIREDKLAKFKAEREYNISMLLGKQKLSQAQINSVIVEQNKLLNEAYAITDRNYKLSELQKEQVDVIRQGYADYIQQYDELNNAADIYSGKLQTLIDDSMTLLPSGIKITTEAWGNLVALIQESNSIVGQQVMSIDDISTALAESEAQYVKNLQLQYSSAKVGDEDIARAAQQLAIEELLTQSVVDKLQAQQDSLAKEIEVLNTKKEQAEAEKDLIASNIEAKADEIVAEQNYVAELKKRGVVGNELVQEQRKSNERLLQLQTELVNLKTEEQEKNISISSIEQDKVGTEDKIFGLEKDINKELGKNEASRKKIYSNLKEELKLTDKIADWWQKYGEVAQGVVDTISAGMDLLSTKMTNSIAMMQQAHQQDMLNRQANIDQLNAELELLNDNTKSQQDKLDELNAMREDADASRLARIDAEIAAVQEKGSAEAEAIKTAQNALIQAENDKKTAEWKYNNEMAVAENKKAQQDKKMNLINAAMNAALAVVKAAPNPVMMAIAGVVGALGVAAIAATKVPPPLVYPKPQLTPLVKEKGGLLVGPRHSAGGIHIEAEGGEWIAPRWMMSNKRTAPIIGELERIRTKKYADGGQVINSQPAVVEAQRQAIIDYDMLAEKLAALNIWVSVAEIKDVDRKFTKVVYQGSSI